MRENRGASPGGAKQATAKLRASHRQPGVERPRIAELLDGNRTEHPRFAVDATLKRAPKPKRAFEEQMPLGEGGSENGCEGSDSFAPSGPVATSVGHPRLAAWAAFFRRFAAFGRSSFKRCPARPSQRG